VGVGDALSLADLVTEGYRRHDFNRVVLVYTEFTSMLTQTPVFEQLLPLNRKNFEQSNEAQFDGDIEESLDKIISNYIGGIIYYAVCESVASEHGARRSAMSSANKNAEEMIDALMLKFNRARQAVITQEITEIVSGAEAL
jgi:F-type H+-transporting ATPase subunit gamma